MTARPTTSRRRSSAALAVVVVAAVTLSLLYVVPVAAQQTDGPPPSAVSWQSAGDSYASGEGVYGNVDACAQSDKAYGPVAADILQGEHAWGITNETFTACTGHLVEDYFHPRGDSDGKSSLWGWGREQGGPGRVDVITMSFGGNDIGFSDVIIDCLVGLPDSWGEFLGGALVAGGVGAAATTATGCDTSEAELNSRIDALTDPPRRNCTTNRRRDKVYDCDIAIDGRRGTLTDFYWDIVTNRLTDRGRLYIVGYPRVFADTDQWANRNVVTCAGVKRGDTQKLGRAAERLNNVLQDAVRRANGALGSDRVVFVDRFAIYRDGQHELCGRGEDWLNGISTNRGDGIGLRKETSFHPNEAGHAATAALLVDRVDATFPRRSAAVSGAPTWDEFKDASIPELCGHPPTTLVDGVNVDLRPEQQRGVFELNRTLPNGNPGTLSGVPSEKGPLTAVTVTCSAGGVGWPDSVIFFSAGGEFYGHTDLFDGDWEALDLYGPGRCCFHSWSLDGSDVVIHTSAQRADDIACCPTGAAVVWIRPSNGRIDVVRVDEPEAYFG